jgi:predicted DCC family thiol-disulfide oxidoreductase YuxK
METVTQLPTPDERPEADVLIFDGHCRICRAQVERLARWDRKGRLAFVSLHEPLVAERYTDLSHDYLMRNMVVVDQRGGRHAGAEAARYLSHLLPALWIFAPLMHIPFSMPLWQWMYRQIATRRYLLGGKIECDGDACAVHFK